MTNSEITLVKEVQQILFNGGQIVKTITPTDDGGKNTTILIRMPKGKFIKDDRKGELYEDNYFEYLICQDFCELGTVQLMSYTNDSLLQAKKITLAKHVERTYSRR
tara:strand:+ start:137 stop:454 length:318 start_codon:yes stop_codon:yes gene_type:complete